MRKCASASQAHSGLGGAAAQSRGERLVSRAQPLRNSSAHSGREARKRLAAAASTPWQLRGSQDFSRSSSGQKRPRESGMGVTAG